jgi:hypothetical protein
VRRGAGLAGAMHWYAGIGAHVLKPRAGFLLSPLSSAKAPRLQHSSRAAPRSAIMACGCPESPQCQAGRPTGVVQIDASFFSAADLAGVFRCECSQLWPAAGNCGPPG